ncbi:MAG: aminopeptidase, partial [Clostridiaceae bacterium]|nr:aminopeptidase [Clostridiaceae bacterium]
MSDQYKNLTYKTTNVWDAEFSKKDIMEFSENYKLFLDKAKTEREFIKESVILAK